MSLLGKGFWKKTYAKYIRVSNTSQNQCLSNSVGNFNTNRKAPLKSFMKGRRIKYHFINSYV